MLQIAIVEDTQKDADDIARLISAYARERGENIKTERFPSAVAFLDAYRPVYDIVLLDIQMPHMDGMEAARRLRKVDPSVPLVFITSMSNCAVQGYSVSALDFVVKPVATLSFNSMLEKPFAWPNREQTNW